MTWVLVTASPRPEPERERPAGEALAGVFGGGRGALGGERFGPAGAVARQRRAEHVRQAGDDAEVRPALAGLDAADGVRGDAGAASQRRPGQLQLLAAAGERSRELGDQAGVGELELAAAVERPGRPRPRAQLAGRCVDVIATVFGKTGGEPELAAT